MASLALTAGIGQRSRNPNSVIRCVGVWPEDYSDWCGRGSQEVLVANLEPKNSAFMSLLRKSATASAGRCTIGSPRRLKLGVEDHRDPGAGGEAADQPVVQRVLGSGDRLQPRGVVHVGDPGIWARRSALTGCTSSMNGLGW